ncbi:Uncharacterized protein HZ326_22377 [Fusarium oxysporum f. sp. albedinis]|nr:Uncharacterized protein HZ326_22377 [Fusarium oxysporum f. sp. albedinis]
MWLLPCIRNCGWHCFSNRKRPDQKHHVNHNGTSLQLASTKSVPLEIGASQTNVIKFNIAPLRLHVAQDANRMNGSHVSDASSCLTNASKQFSIS